MKSLHCFMVGSMFSHVRVKRPASQYYKQLLLFNVWEQEPTLHRKCRAGSERAVTEY